MSLSCGSFNSELIQVPSSAVKTCSSGMWSEARVAFFTLSNAEICMTYCGVITPLSPTTLMGHFMAAGQSWSLGKQDFTKFKAIATTTGTTGWLYVTYGR